MERADIAIIGSGPAGISAAINAKIRHHSFYLFGYSQISDKVKKSEKILNVPGFFQMSGEELIQKYQKHLDDMDIQIQEEKITAIYKMGKYYSLFVNDKEYQARCIIMATGVETIKPYVGELEFLGRGVSYCATCDGHLYKDKKIAIVCDSLSLEHEVEYLANIATHVYYFPLFKGSQINRDNIQYMNQKIIEIQGQQKVTNLLLENEENLEIDGIFFLKQSISPAVLLRNLEIEDSHIKVDRHMQTNLKGCFAAGDCVGRPYQIVKALGEGNIAAHSAFEYLGSMKEKK